MLKLEECAHTLLRGSFVLGTQDEVWSTDSLEAGAKRDDGADAIIACSGLSVPGVWIHDLLYAANNGKGYKGYHWSTDEEVNSGKNLFEKSWRNYTRDKLPYMHFPGGEAGPTSFRRSSMYSVIKHTITLFSPIL